MNDPVTPDSAEAHPTDANTTGVSWFSVPEMSCGHCVSSITKEVSAVAGVTAVAVDLDAKTVSVSGGDEAEVIAAIDEAGFDIATG